MRLFTFDWPKEDASSKLFGSLCVYVWLCFFFLTKMLTEHGKYSFAQIQRNLQRGALRVVQNQSFGSILFVTQ